MTLLIWNSIHYSNNTFALILFFYNNCCLLRVYSPFTFNVFTDTVGLRCTILLFIFYLPHCSVHPPPITIYVSTFTTYWTMQKFYISTLFTLCVTSTDLKISHWTIIIVVALIKNVILYFLHIFFFRYSAFLSSILHFLLGEFYFTIFWRISVLGLVFSVGSWVFKFNFSLFINLFATHL